MAAVGGVHDDVARAPSSAAASVSARLAGGVPWSRRRRRRPRRRRAELGGGERLCDGGPTSSSSSRQDRTTVRLGAEDRLARPARGNRRRRSWRPCRARALSKGQARRFPRALRPVRVRWGIAATGAPEHREPRHVAAHPARRGRRRPRDVLAGALPPRATTSGADGEAALDALAARAPGLVLLDLGLGPADRRRRGLPPAARIRHRAVTSWSSRRAATRPNRAGARGRRRRLRHASPSGSRSCAAGCAPRSGASRAPPPSRRGLLRTRRARAGCRRADGPLGGRRAAR